MKKNNENIATALKVKLSYDGEAFALYKKTYSSSDFAKLFYTDNHHCSKQGFYLAACTTFATMTGVDPTDLDFTGTAPSADEALRMRKIAAITAGVAKN